MYKLHNINRNLCQSVILNEYFKDEDIKTKIVDFMFTLNYKYILLLRNFHSEINLLSSNTNNY